MWSQSPLSTAKIQKNFGHDLIFNLDKHTTLKTLTSSFISISENSKIISKH
jgi:hypothetical protein